MKKVGKQKAMPQTLHWKTFCKFVGMKTMKQKYVRWTVEGILAAFVLVCRFVPDCGEWYARTVYPSVSFVLSACTGWIPFSLEEWVVTGCVAALVLIPWAGRKKKASWRTVLRREAELLVIVWCWFYVGWGANYFRHDFFTRSGTERAEYRADAFGRFLRAYTDSLNKSYTISPMPSREKLESELKAVFASVRPHFGLARPRPFHHPKRVAFNGLYSGVGVLGFMGPFFSESQLNRDLLPVEYPFTYAHEYSHLLGVSSEAEANFWAYQICIRSDSPAVRYSGYFGLLPYVLSNARSLLPEEAYAGLVSSVRPEVLDDLREKQAHWASLYSPFVGSVQETVYSWYLKGNRIPSAQKNYAEVIGMILSLPDSLALTD